MSDRIALPCRLRIRRQRPAIGEDLAEVASLAEKADDAGGIEDFVHPEADFRTDPRQASNTRVVLAQVLLALLVERLGPRPNFSGFQVGGNVYGISASIGPPDSRQVRLAIRRLGQGRREVGLTVRGPRNSGSFVIQPLPVGGCGQKE